MEIKTLFIFVDISMYGISNIGIQNPIITHSYCHLINKHQWFLYYIYMAATTY